MKHLVLSLLALLLITGVVGPGCKKQESTPAPKPDQPAQSTPPRPAESPSLTNNPSAPTNTVEQGVTSLLNTFQTAPETTRTRIQSAVDSIRAGKDREAIVQLKLVDADSNLNSEQAQSIKDLINIIRKQEPP